MTDKTEENWQATKDSYQALLSRIEALEQQVAQMRDLLDDPSKAYYEKRKELPLEAV